MRPRTFAAAAALLVVPAGASRGQEPAAAYELRPAEGAEVRYALTLETEESVAQAGGETKTSARIEADLSIVGLSDGGRGVARLELRIGRVQGVAADPARGVLPFDSETASAAPSEERARWPAEAWLAGCAFEVDCSSRGEVQSIGGLNAALEAARGRAGDDAALVAAATDAVTAQRVRELAAWLFGPAPFPSGPAPAGTKWSQRDAVPAVAGRFRVLTTWFHRVAAERPEELDVETAGAVSASTRDPDLAQGAVTSGTSEGKGTWLRADGLPVRWRAEARFGYEARTRDGTSSVRVNHVTRTTLERRAEAPPPPPAPMPGALEFRPPPGLQKRYALVFDSVQTLTIADRDSVTQTTWNLEVSVKGLPDGPAGERRAEVRFGRVRGTRSSALAGRSAYDSSSKPSASEIDRAAWAAGTALAGCAFQATFDGSGRLGYVGGLAEAAATAQRRCAGDRALAEMTVPFVAEAKVRAMLGWILAATPYWHEAVRQGLAWDDRDVLPAAAPQAVATNVWRHRVESLDAKSVTLSSEGTVEAAPTDASLAGARVASSRATATMRISRDEGLPLEAKTESEFVLEAAETTLRQQVRSTLAPAR